jgi:hypothetical protein
MNQANQKKMCKQVLTYLVVASSQSSTTSGTTMSTSSSAAALPRPTISMLTVPVPVPAPSVFQVSLTHRTLPIQIQAAFPHITLQLSTVLGCSRCPALRCVINTAAALSTGNLHFFAAIAKAYPHTIPAIHSQADYAPITLSSIVQQSDAFVTTELTVNFQFHLLYLTREGHPTALSIATGPNVTVNMILGLPFIQKTRMVIDTSNQVANLCALNTPPFSIDFCWDMCTIPAVDGVPITQGTPAQYANIIKEADHIVAFHSTKDKLTSILLLARQFCRVDFDNTSPAPAMSDELPTATIGSAIKPKLSYNTDSFSLFDLPCST